MFNLLDPNISYMIVSATKETNTEQLNSINNNKLNTILYSRDYIITPVKGYYKSKWEDSFIAVCPNDNDTLRTDTIYILDNFGQDSIIVKYKGDVVVKKIKRNGEERDLDMLVYDSNLDNKTYIYNGYSFSFLEKKRYVFPKSKSELKPGMLIEYFNNERWNQRQIVNLDLEFEKTYNLLIKYNKLRFCPD